MKWIGGVAVIVALAWAFSATKQVTGPYNSYLVLRDEGGNSRLFFLGGYISYRECAEQGIYEVENFENEQNIFWTNSVSTLRFEPPVFQTGSL